MARREDQCVDMHSLAEGQTVEELACSICLQLMVNPYRTDCYGGEKHLFGYNCIKKWISQQGETKRCPLCRTPFSELFPQLGLQESIKSVKAICKDCQTLIPVHRINIHQLECLKRQERLRAELQEVVHKEKSYLLQQITPHLREYHRGIFDEYVREWEWLLNDPRDWKWWWWASQPWWQNQACQTCNYLWHKYEINVDREEGKRIMLLAELGVKMKQQEKNEQVRCENQ